MLRAFVWGRFVEAFVLGVAAVLATADSPASELAARDWGHAFGREIARFDLGGEIQSVAWSRDQQRLVAVVDSLQRERRRIVSIDALQWSVEWSIDGGDTRGGKVAFLESDQAMVTRSLAPIGRSNPNEVNILSVVDAATGRVVRHVAAQIPNLRLNHRTMDFSLSEDGNSIAVLTGTSLILGFDVKTWSQIWRVDLRHETSEGEPLGMKIALDGKRGTLHVAALARHGGPIQTWDVSRNSLIATFVPYKSAPSQMLLDPPAGVLFTGGDGGLRGLVSLDPSAPRWPDDDPTTLVKAWNPATGELIATYDGPGQGVRGLALSPNRRYLLASKTRDGATGASLGDAQVLVWDVESHRIVATSNYGQRFPQAVSFSPDGRQIAIADGRELQIIDLNPALFP